MRRTPTSVQLLRECSIILVEAVSVLFLFNHTAVLFGALFVISFGCFWLWYDREDKIFFLVAALVGPLAEIAAAYRGAWTYTRYDFLLIPVWLPLAWGVVIVAIKRISNLISERRSDHDARG